MSKQDKWKLGRLLSSFVLLVLLIIVSKLGILDRNEWYITLVIYIIPYLIAGYDVLLEAVSNIVHLELFDEAFLMMLASVGAFVIGEYDEAVAVMVLYQIGEFLSDLAVDRSRDSIEELMNICPQWANLLRDGEMVRLSPQDVKISDVIVIKPGERVPLDGVVVDGTSYLDTSALTGESVKRKISQGDEVLSGCLNGEGTFSLKVTQIYENSTVARILNMVENSSDKKSHTENFITRFARVYTPIVTALALLIAIIPSVIVGGSYSEWIRRACTFLVISCPCALVISVPLSFFAGIGAASNHGILIKGGNYLEMLSNLKVVAFDKTGTITEGSFDVLDVKIYDDRFSKEDILFIAAKMEQFSNHPIAMSIRSAYETLKCDETKSDYEVEQSKQIKPFHNITAIKEMPGYGISGIIDGVLVQLGGEKLLSKLNMQPNYVNHKLAKDTNHDIAKDTNHDIAKDTNQDASPDATLVYVVYGEELIARVIIGDSVKESSAEAIASLKREGVDLCVMLTGDRLSYAQRVADEVGVDDCRAELLPDEKVSIVEEYLKRYREDKRSYVAFAGDGINDAPTLMRADVGIAMGMGTDAAIEASDVVLVHNDLMQIVRAIRISRKTVRIAKENIVFALCVKFLVLLLGAFGLVGMWMAVFADVGVSLLAVCNALRAMKMEECL